MFRFPVKFAPWNFIRATFYLFILFQLFAAFFFPPFISAASL